MIVIVNGQKKDLHYSIAAKLLKQGKAEFPGNENEEKKVVKNIGNKKIVKKTGKAK